MPKSAPRRKRIRAARVQADPTALPSANDGPSNSGKSGKKTAAAGKDKELAPVLQKIQSTTPNDRLWSTSAVSHILSAADAGTRRALQSKNIVGILIDRLSDDEIEIQAEACGALRNLAIEGGPEVCAEMFNKAVIPALAKHLDPIDANLASVLGENSMTDDTQDKIVNIVWNWTDNLANLFCCLAETSEKAFRAVVALPKLSSILYRLLQNAVPSHGGSSSRSKVPLSVAVSAAQAVYVLTDTNVPSAPKFALPRGASLAAAHAATRQMLFDALKAASATLAGKKKMSEEQTDNLDMFRVLCIGISQNLSAQYLKGATRDVQEEEAFVALSLKTLIHGLTGVDLNSQSENALHCFQSLPSGGQTISAEAASLSPQRTGLDKVEKTWTRVRLTLEILGELCAEIDGIVDTGLLGDEVYEEWNGIASNGDADMQEEAATKNDMQEDGLQEVNTTQKPESLSMETVDALSSLPLTLLTLARPTVISFAEANGASQNSTGLMSSQVDAPPSNPSTYVPNLTELVSLVHARALESLNNLLITLGRASKVPAAAPDETAPDTEENDLEMLDNDETAVTSQPGELDDDGFDETTQQDRFAKFLQSNLSLFQESWESLFQLLVNYLSFLQSHQQRLGPGSTTPKQSQKGGAVKVESACASALQACLGSIWALARLVIDSLTIGPDETKVLLEVLNQNARGLVDVDSAVRCIGALGVMASRIKADTEENGVIGRALISKLSDLSNEAQGKQPPQDSGEMYAQVLDVIFDIYADETRAYDEPVFVQGGFLSALQGIVETFRRLVKSIDRRKYPDIRKRADDALINLGEFIKYRKTLL